MNIACNPAQYEALRKILEHEKVPFTTGLGPGCFAITVEKQHEKNFRSAIKQWHEAISSIIRQEKVT